MSTAALSKWSIGAPYAVRRPPAESKSKRVKLKCRAKLSRSPEAHGHRHVGAGGSKAYLALHRPGRKSAAILIGYVVALSLFAGLVAFDIRVAAWVASVTQAKFIISESPGISGPILRA